MRRVPWRFLGPGEKGFSARRAAFCCVEGSQLVEHGSQVGGQNGSQRNYGPRGGFLAVDVVVRAQTPAAAPGGCRRWRRCRGRGLHCVNVAANDRTHRIDAVPPWLRRIAAYALYCDMQLHIGTLSPAN